MGWTNDAFYWKATVEGQDAPVYVKAVGEIHARALIERMGHVIVMLEEGFPVKAARKTRVETKSMFDKQFRSGGAGRCR